MSSVDKFQTRKIIFMGEQNGPAETRLKNELLHCLEREDDIWAAYLVRVSYEETPGIAVALCLHGRPPAVDTVLQCVGSAFRGIFRATDHLDTLFFDDDQIRNVAVVAKPFFVRNAKASTN